MAERYLDATCGRCDLLVTYERGLRRWVHVPINGLRNDDHTPAVSWSARLRVRLEAWKTRRLLRRWTR